MTRGKNDLEVPTEPFFLLSTGKLIDVNGQTYEDFVYKRYTGANFIFDKTYKQKEVVEFGENKNKLTIEDGKTYLYSGNTKTHVTSIKGTSRSLTAWVTQNLTGVYALTAEGEAWYSYCDGTFNTKFEKISTNGKVQNVAKIKPSSPQGLYQPYFLLENGLLVNKDGYRYGENY